ncbi:aldo/keto reductase [Actinocrispum wychmicini]|uniref:Aryl-alcohol dehydrogenase-like predicted oxidoreductase n=1 Tax=Actinocrispum wychmicini TaxID=1213861 RepID=A0A4R2JYT4_9PSEU|nr:aldo/keto reductase [Actinocrispum wychmicini]TCO65084.1 aryl-alcohol dehydrogenase-like predicted oxidoreductase [Actinocrispum wychmicini]
MTHYHLLGRTGLRVSPLALGTMTFGAPDWGSDEDTSRAIFQRYLEWGGNFVDSAVNYAGGASEELLGKFLAETGSRERIVLATKFTGAVDATDPNGWGNGRKNILRSLDTSLRRLGTDYIDLYWLHFWDTYTPVEEIVSTLDTLVRAGKVRAVGFSDVPAWYAAKAHTLAVSRGLEPVNALQMEYSLVERNIEREHVPAMRDMGMGLIPWSPLGGGFLTGKYTRAEDGRLSGDGRFTRFEHFRRQRHGDQKWAILDQLVKVAGEVGCTPAQAALNWVANRPTVTSTIIGASTRKQLDDNLGALDFDVPHDELTELSKPEPHHPYNLYDRSVWPQLPFIPDLDIRSQP